MVSFSLENKVALITGGSRGIGEAVALGLSDYGASCILVGRKMETLEDVKQKIVGRGGKARAYACNTGQMDQIRALFDTIRDQEGKLDILINNAATNPYFGGLLDAPEWAMDKTFDVNLKGPFFLSQYAAKMMAGNGGGSIVNVASINGIRPAPFQGIYSMTKAAMISMTKAFAKELATSNIRVNALLPGLTETKFSAAIIDNKDIYNYALGQIPMNRHASPDEMVGAVLYLVSDAASFTTGAVIACDGGALT
jgi:NAD(P)-dependent dehydrogenase (short-subunit alcohol dehydrogenase family)